MTHEADQIEDDAVKDELEEDLHRLVGERGRRQQQRRRRRVGRRHLQRRRVDRVAHREPVGRQSSSVSRELFVGSRDWLSLISGEACQDYPTYL